MNKKSVGSKEAAEMFFIYVLRTERTLECPSGLFQNSPANEPRAI